MAPLRDPYVLLDLDRSADLVTVKRAYRRLAKRYHPDARRDDGHLFVALRVAYETLSDPDRRADWDRRHPGSGHARRPGQASSARGPSASTRPGTRPAGDGSGREPASNGRGNGHTGEPIFRPRDGRGRFVRFDAPPWWEEIRGSSRYAGPDLPGARGDPHLGPSSSGAAWSSASRAYFRKLTRPEKQAAR